MCIKIIQKESFFVHKRGFGWTQLNHLKQESVVLALTDTQKKCYERGWRSVEVNNQVMWFPDSGMWSLAWGRNHAYKPYTIVTADASERAYKVYNPPVLGGKLCPTSAEAEEHIILSFESQ